MNHYASLCDDFYVNMNLGTEMELPANRETVLHFFERIQKTYPTMRNFYCRERGDFILEEDKDQGAYRWCTIEPRRVCSGQVNPDSIDAAMEQHKLILELAPYMLSVSPLDCEALDLLFGFDFTYRGNHNQLMAEVLGVGPSMEPILEVPGATVINYEPSVTIAVDPDCRLQLRISVETRTNAYQVRMGEYPEEQLSVYVTARQYGSLDPDKTFVADGRSAAAVVPRNDRQPRDRAHFAAVGPGDFDPVADIAITVGQTFLSAARNAWTIGQTGMSAPPDRALLPSDRQPASGKKAVCRVVQAESGPPVQLEVRRNQIGQAGVVVVLRAVVARIAAKEGEPLVEDVQLLGQFVLDGCGLRKPREVVARLGGPQTARAAIQRELLGELPTVKVVDKSVDLSAALGWSAHGGRNGNDDGRLGTPFVLLADRIFETEVHVGAAVVRDRRSPIAMSVILTCGSTIDVCSISACAASGTAASSGVIFRPDSVMMASGNSLAAAMRVTVSSRCSKSSKRSVKVLVAVGGHGQWQIPGNFERAELLGGHQVFVEVLELP